MDPNKALKTLKEIVNQVNNEEDNDVNDQLEDFVRHFDALDGWISNGGFLPKEWSVK